MKWHYKKLNYSIIACLIVLVDIVTKQLALHHCQYERIINSFIYCELTINKGMSWSLFNKSHYFFIIFLSMLVIFFFAWYTHERMYKKYTIYGEIMVLAGAISNIFDRFIYGGVIDFIVIHYKTYAWPTFNVADIAIVLGGMLMLLTEKLYAYHKK